MYSYGTVCHKVLNKRVPDYKPEVLSAWFTGKGKGVKDCSRMLRGDITLLAKTMRGKAVLHVLERACNAIAILSAMDIIERTCELARVFGIDFFSVISRGSQYRYACALCLRNHCVHDVLLRNPHPE